MQNATGEDLFPTGKGRGQAPAFVLSGRRPILRISLVLALFVCCATASGYTGPAQELFEDALTRIDNHDYDGAVIQFRNAIQKHPTDPTIRFELAKLYLDLYKGAEAEKELTKALENGAKRSKLLVALGRAYLIQSKADAVLDEIRRDLAEDEQMRGEIELLRGDAHFSLNHIADAEASYQRAKELLPFDGRPDVGMGRALLAMGKTDEAGERANGVVNAMPGFVPALVLSGDIQRIRRRPDSAIAFYTKALQIEPRHVPALIGRGATRVGQDDEAAIDDLISAKKIAPQHPLASYYHAMVLARQENYSGALDVLDDNSLSALHSPSILLRGALYLGQGSIEQAEEALAFYVLLFPDDVNALRLLGASQIRADEWLRAQGPLRAVLARNPEDFHALFLLGVALTQTKEFNDAAMMLERAAMQMPPELDIRAALAQALALGGELDRAAIELEAIIGEQDIAVGETVLLVHTLVRDGKTTAALKAAKALAKRTPESPLARNLVGVALLADGRNTDAQASFEAALTLDDGFTPAALNLAKLEFDKGNAAGTQQRYLAILDRDPQNTSVMLALADLEAVAMSSLAEMEWLEKVLGVDRHHAPARERIVKLRLAEGNREAAIDQLRLLEALAPKTAVGLASLGRAQAAMGENEAAVATFHELLGTAPRYAPYRHWLANALLADDQPQAARDTLLKAIEDDPEYLPVRIALIGLSEREEWFEEGLSYAEAFVAAQPDSAYPHRLTGDLLMHAERYAEAAQAYQDGLNKERNSLLALRRHQAQISAGQIDQTLEEIKAWLQSRPSDHLMRAMLAETHARLGEHERAIVEYERVLAARPDNADALNNLAWLYRQRQDPRAYDLAERAYRNAPAAPHVLDTLGWLLIERGDTARGLGLLSKARHLAPDKPGISYHLAVALEHAGLPMEAKRELEQLLQRFPEFEDANAARVLLSRLIER